jgi:predicted Zn-dependent protease with MMP-like domain
LEINDDIRDRFDRMLEHVIDELPPQWREMLDEVPVIVEDYPTRRLLDEVHVERPEYLCGLHSGIPLTRRSVQHSGVMPNNIIIYRLGVITAARAWSRRHDRALLRQVRITLLHEMGHYFGLDEDDLRELGYH